MSTHEPQNRAELLQAPPRVLGRRKKRPSGCLTSFAIFATFLGFALLRSAFITAMAKLDGVSVPARITGVRVVNGRRAPTAYLRYRYVWRNREYSDEALVPPTMAQTVPNGAVMQARLWPRNPETDTFLILPDGSDTALLFGLMALGPPLFLVGLSVPAGRFYLAHRQRSLLKNGVAVAARVQRSYAVTDQSRNIEYSFVPYGGDAEITGRATVEREVQALDGWLITALYDPRNPRHFMLYAERSYDIGPTLSTQ